MLVRVQSQAPSLKSVKDEVTVTEVYWEFDKFINPSIPSMKNMEVVDLLGFIDVMQDIILDNIYDET